jgi:hypothetical protein
MLLAHLAETVAIEEFAFELDRARDFADDLDRGAAQAERRFTCQLVLASIRASFAAGLNERSPNIDLNRRIGSAILAAFREELFDTTGSKRLAERIMDGQRYGGMIEGCCGWMRPPDSFRLSTPAFRQC